MEARVAVRSDEISLDHFKRFNLRELREETGGFHSFLDDLKEKGFYTYRRTLLSCSRNRVWVWDEAEGRAREMIMLGSNNYLGLTHHPKVIESGREALRKYGAGSGGAPLLCGTFDLHRRLEEKLAAFKGTEAAIVWPSGYSTNVGCIPPLLGPDDTLLLDRLSHASLIDGSMLTKARVRYFRHSSLDSLERTLALEASPKRGQLIVVEGVYSMDGDIAPLPQIKELADRYGGRILVDDAHATGVLGPNGRGSAEHFGMGGKIDITVGTFSKSLAGAGGFVASTREVVEYLRYFARSYVFSASPPPAVAASVLAALEVIEEEPAIRERLWRNIRYMKQNLDCLGYDTGASQSAVIPIIVGDDHRLRLMSREIDRAGIYLNAITYPAVLRNSARFRLSITADHTQSDLDDALEVLERVGKAHGVL